MKKESIIAIVLIVINILLIIIQSIDAIAIPPIIGGILAFLFIVGIVLLQKPLLNFKKKKKFSILALVFEIPVLFLLFICTYDSLSGLEFFTLSYGLDAFTYSFILYFFAMPPFTILISGSTIASIIMFTKINKKK